MTGHSDVIREYVKNYALNYLTGLRNTQELEGPYAALDLGVKLKTTQQLTLVADRLTDCLLGHKNPVEDLSDPVIRKCLLTALKDD